MITIEIYPKARRPNGLKTGCFVECLGDGLDVFAVVEVDSTGYRALLVNSKGHAHGWESFTKLKVVPKPKVWR